MFEPAALVLLRFVLKLMLRNDALFLLRCAVQVRWLLAECPKNTGSSYRVDQRGLDAVVALGIYHLQSGLKASVEAVFCLTSL